MITDDDFARAAAAIGCDVAAIKAVCYVEAPRGGFLSDGTTPVILFEAQHFHRLTGGVYGNSHPGISSATWNRALYATGKDADERGRREHQRLQEASALNRDAALQSASWGKFQIMGFNCKYCGYDSVQAFVNAMYRDEGAHLDAFVGFVKQARLDKALCERRWMDFARGYNGPSYAANQYDQKLAAAYLAAGGTA